MADVAIKLPKEKIVEGLSSLSLIEIKELIDSLIQRKYFMPPSAKSIYKEASGITRGKNLPAKVAEEAVTWARNKK